MALPTITRLTAAYAAGSAALIGFTVSPLPTAAWIALLATALVLGEVWLRVARSLPSNLAFALAGGLLTHGALADRAQSCLHHLRDGAIYELTGALLQQPGSGSTAIALRMIGGRECATTVRALLPRRHATLDAGAGIRARGEWSRDMQASVLAAAPGLLILHDVRADSTRDGLAAVRGNAVRDIRALFGPQAPLAEALLVAERSGIDPELSRDFAASGLAHLLAISGTHVALVSAVLLLLTTIARLPPLVGGIIGGAGATAYVLFLGAPYPALRAALQILLLLGTRALQRPAHPFGLLSTAAFAILIYDPLAILDIGFQLSFAGLAGILAWRKPILAALPASSPRALNDAIATSTAATLATTPVCAYHFAQVSLIAVPANLLALPLVSLAVPAAALALITNTVSAAAAHFFAGGACLLLQRLADTARLAASVPGGHVYVTRATVLAAALALLLGWITARRLWTLRRPFRLGVSWALALTITVTSAPALRARNADALEIHLIDVGQGDAVALRSPRGHWILIDAGPRSDRYDSGARRVVPFLLHNGAEKLDLLVLTHPHADHVGGAPAVAQVIEPRIVLDPDSGRIARNALESVARAVSRAGGRWLRARPGLRVTIDELDLEVLHPPGLVLDPSMDANDYSVVIRLAYGAFDALFMGDAPSLVEAELAERFGRRLDVDVLKVGHHGSNTSTSAEWIELTTPQVALISAGRRNRYGHPSAVVLERLEQARVRTLRTDREGTISLRAFRDGRVERIRR